MLRGDERTLRGGALALFGLQVLLQVGYVVGSRGLGDQPELSYPYELHATTVWAGLLPGLVGLVLAWLRPQNPIGWLISLSGTFLCAATFGDAYGARAAAFPSEGLPAGDLVLSLTAPLWIPALFICVTHLLVRYPTGTVEGRWPVRFDRAALAGFVLVYVGYATSIESVTDVVVDGEPPVLLPTGASNTLLIVGGAIVLLSALAIVGDAIARAVRAPGPVRMALLWLLTTSVLGVTIIFAGTYEWTGEVIYAAVMLSVAVGVLRYRALGIDVVIQRALVYVMLTGAVLLVLVVVVAGLTRLAPDGPLPQVVAAAIVAVGLAPARDRIQRFIDRLLYGVRDDPFVALQQLSSPMQATAGEELLPGILSALADALRVEGVSITGPSAVSYGTMSGDPTEVPLEFAGESVGALVVSARRGESRLSPTDVRLLAAVAPLVAAVVHSVALADDLRTEKARVVEATELERHRLRQELHDGLGPSLTGIGLGLEAVTGDRPRDAEILGRLRAEIASALEETRRIIDDLGPEALDKEDLTAALRRRTSQIEDATGIEIRFEAPESLPPLPPPVAAAALRIAEEALTNVVRHANASSCDVRLSVDGALHLEVSDDGSGPGSPSSSGVGLTSMRERAERLGGRFDLTDARPGTTLRAELPLELVP